MTSSGEIEMNAMTQEVIGPEVEIRLYYSPSEGLYLCWRPPPGDLHWHQGIVQIDAPNSFRADAASFFGQNSEEMSAVRPPGDSDPIAAWVRTNVRGLSPSADWPDGVFDYVYR